MVFTRTAGRVMRKNYISHSKASGQSNWLFSSHINRIVQSAVLSESYWGKKMYNCEMSHFKLVCLNISCVFWMSSSHISLENFVTAFFQIMRVGSFSYPTYGKSSLGFAGRN